MTTQTDAAPLLRTRTARWAILIAAATALTGAISFSTARLSAGKVSDNAAA